MSGNSYNNIISLKSSFNNTTSIKSDLPIPSKENLIKVEINFDSIDSTQIYARRYLEEKRPKSWVLITSEEQTGGIGRHDRKWYSPKGKNIYLSLIIPLDYKKSEKLIQYLPIITCVTLSQVIEHFGCETKIKWVNDILIKDENKFKKAAGVLIESILEGDSFYLIIGMGINVNMNQFEFINVDQAATSMKICKGKEFKKEMILNELKIKIQDNIDGFNTLGKDYFLDYYNKKLAYVNSQVKIVDKFGNENIGILKGIDNNGYLLLQDEKNKINTFYDGRLFFVK
jgi:BirA family transcriptional regulator, biotin operon repressor / biotin---[acetyl-CoA-carboxylase] ligase